MAARNYSWLVDDTDSHVTRGIGGLAWVGVIQPQDAYGGYNTRFAISGNTGEYHIHFARNGVRVKCIRYKHSSSDALGTNMFRFDNRDGPTPPTLNDLIFECQHGYFNWWQLLTNFKSAIKNVPRTRNNELSNVVAVP